ncbi:MAG: LysR family transcriptional regulator [Labilithrix sp.]|nr:LysR family transcriptional regulator [Labilithrix sp.]MCW5814936.1 LysR family transcriptional regulator [Labilithrix sp.]
MRATPDDIVGMAFFARVVEAKSFRDAARSLGVSKSAVSARVARLEAALGLKLLHRTTRRLALTADGVRLYERCARLVAEADQAAEVAAGASAAPRGTLRVHASSALAGPIFARTIGEFTQAYPEVRVELRFIDRAPDPTPDPFDVAVVVSRRLADSGLVARKLATSRAVVCAAPAYLRRRGIPFRPQDLVHHDCLRLLHTEDWQFDTDEGRIPLPSARSLCSDDARFLRESVLAGLGIAVLPRFVVGDDLASGRLHAILEDFHANEVSILALHAHRRLASASVRAFVEHLAEVFGKTVSQPRAKPVAPPAQAKATRPRGASIPMTAQDVRRLSAVAAVYAETDPAGSARLRERLERLTVLAADAIPRSAVTMSSRVTLREGAREREVSLVYPWDAAAADRVSVLSDLGAVLLGAKVGSTVSSQRITAIPYQPEAAGDHHL